MSDYLKQSEYKGQVIVEQNIFDKNTLYIITRNKNNGKYILWLDGKKLSESENMEHIKNKML